MADVGVEVAGDDWWVCQLLVRLRVVQSVGDGGLTPADVKHEVMNIFDGYFTFIGWGEYIQQGDECSLETTAVPDGPVRVEQVSDNGWMFRSLRGHPEGVGRFIKFEFCICSGNPNEPTKVRM